MMCYIRATFIIIIIVIKSAAEMGLGLRTALVWKADEAAAFLTVEDAGGLTEPEEAQFTLENAGVTALAEEVDAAGYGLVDGLSNSENETCND